MIKSFGNGGTEDIFNNIFNSKQAARYPREILRKAFLLLHAMNTTISLDALKVPPGNRLKQLEGSRKGIWSLKINEQWRIIFKFENGDFFSVLIEDYH